jgi:hypothetical protein
VKHLMDFLFGEDGEVIDELVGVVLIIFVLFSHSLLSL